MQPKIALTIGSVLAAVFGLLLILGARQMLAGAGLGVSGEAVVLSRDVGATLLGLAVLNWMARDATGAVLNAILTGNLVIQVLEIIVNGYEIARGTLPAKAAPGILLHVFLGAVFLLALQKAGSRAKV